MILALIYVTSNVYVCVYIYNLHILYIHIYNIHIHPPRCLIGTGGKAVNETQVSPLRMFTV